jgi:hypothetical protein
MYFIMLYNSMFANVCSFKTAEIFLLNGMDKRGRSVGLFYYLILSARKYREMAKVYILCATRFKYGCLFLKIRYLTTTFFIVFTS